jgi:glycosyltransferase involved in cell wall biosynthesis
MHLSVVIPALNEAGNIGELVQRARAELDQLNIQYEIVVVDGGSKDNTAGEAARAGANVIVYPIPGYGGALRKGFAAAQGEVIITMDSDL